MATEDAPSQCTPRHSERRARRSSRRFSVVPNEVTDMFDGSLTCLCAEEKLRTMISNCAKAEAKELINCNVVLSAFEKAAENVLDELAAEGIFLEMTSQSPTASSTNDELVDDMQVLIRDTEASIQKLKAESKQWDEIQRECVAGRFAACIVPSKSMSSTEASGFDCESLTKRINTKFERLKLQMMVMDRTVSSLCYLNDKFMEKPINPLQVMSEDDKQDSSDCRQLLVAAMDVLE